MSATDSLYRPDEPDDHGVAAQLAILAMPVDPSQRAVDEVKQVSTLQARAALAGAELQRMGDGSFIAFRASWGMHKHLADVPAVEAWLLKVRA